MDPISHTLVTHLVLRKRRLSWRRLFALGNWPDLGYYLLYPTWLARSGRLRSLVDAEAPVPPRSLQIIYDLTHSLVVIGLLALLLRRRIDRNLLLAWAAHIVVDAPTHSRRIYPTRFLWPLSQFALSGWSWAEVLHAHGRRYAAQRRDARLRRVKPALEVLQPAGGKPEVKVLQLPITSPSIAAAQPLGIGEAMSHVTDARRRPPFR